MPNYLFEVGTEELPADFVNDGIRQWQTLVPQTLAEQLLTPQTVEVYGTPRRLAVLIGGIPHQQPNRTEEIKGPPVHAAFKDGKPTKAAEGFARKQGVTLEELEIKNTPKGEFVFVQKQIAGRVALEILPELSLQWIFQLQGRRFMCWGDGDLRFARPIRWLVALLDEEIVSIELENGSERIRSDRLSAGHRILHPQPVSIAHATDYLKTLRRASVEADRAARQTLIEAETKAEAQQLGGVALLYPDLLTEVVDLVEFPSAVVGGFESEFLSLPTEVITTVMVTHQRYFPVKSQQEGDNNLLPYFITVSNGDRAKAKIIAEGNARVIRARLADAQFFYQADCDEPLDSYLPQLENVTFQEELGSMREKVDRIMETAAAIADQLELDPTERGEIESTALLCKADLVTQMVYEFPELQGVMGEKYALVSGESETVARGIFEHYLPRGANDDLPQTLNGQVVAIADRLDSLISIFGIGMIPTGSSDPFALRRAANGIVNIIWHGDLEIDLLKLLRVGSEDFVSGRSDADSPLDALVDFFIGRIETLLQDELGIDYDLVDAVLGENDSQYAQRALEDLLDVRDRAEFLQEIRRNGQLEEIYETVNRSTRLAAKGSLDTTQLDPSAVVNPQLFESPSEQDFYRALIELVPKTEAASADRNYQQLVDSLAEIAPVVSRFFDGEDSVLVMAEEEEVKRNRLNLLGLLRNHARVLADFGPIVKQ